MPLAGDRIGVEVEPDTAGEYRESGDFPVPIGKANFIARGGVETAVNTGHDHLPRGPHRAEGSSNVKTEHAAARAPSSGDVAGWI